jgi:hypothetical protein
MLHSRGPSVKLQMTLRYPLAGLSTLLPILIDRCSYSKAKNSAKLRICKEPMNLSSLHFKWLVVSGLFEALLSSMKVLSRLE